MSSIAVDGIQYVPYDMEQKCETYMHFTFVAKKNKNPLISGEENTSWLLGKHCHLIAII